MSDIAELRPRARDTFVCACGSQWFTRKFQFDSNGVQIGKSEYYECADECGRKHLPTPATIASALPMRNTP